MRQQHPVFDREVDESSTVWRYYSFPKFVSMLTDGSLYFSRADRLGDPLEGSFTKARMLEREHLLANPPAGMTRTDLEHVFERNSPVFAGMPRCTYINCWHLGTHESMAMWRGYGEGAFGVAIQSTFGNLDRILPETVDFSEPPEIFLGRVFYLDHSSETQELPGGYNLYAPFTCKSVAYANEQEVRAVFSDFTYLARDGAPEGHPVPVNLSELIQRVVISPLAPPWFGSVVNAVCHRFGYSFPVSKSRVDIEPMF